MKDDYLIIKDSITLKGIRIIGRTSNINQAIEIKNHFKSLKEYLDYNIIIFKEMKGGIKE